jgi:hypothetical protein
MSSSPRPSDGPKNDATDAGIAIPSPADSPFLPSGLSELAQWSRVLRGDRPITAADLKHLTRNVHDMCTYTVNAPIDDAEVEHTLRVLQDIVDGKTTVGDDLTFLSDAAAEILVKKSKNELSLRNLQFLTNAQAAILARTRCDTLLLDSLERLTDAQAIALASYQGVTLSLNGVPFLSDVQAAAFAKLKAKRLSLNGVKTLSDGQATTLIGGFEGEFLRLDGLISLTDACVDAIVNSRAKTIGLKGLQLPSRNHLRILRTVFPKVIL